MARWHLHGERTVYDNKWLRVRLKDVELPSGARFDMHVVDLKADASGVVVVHPEKGVLMVWQHRVSRDDFGWEIPAGRIDPGETPEQAAARETEEETGWRPGPLTFLGHYKPLAISGHGFNLFAADGATEVGGFDADEIGKVEWKPSAEVRRMVLAGEIVDGLSVTALLWAMAAGRL